MNRSAGYWINEHRKWAEAHPENVRLSYEEVRQAVAKSPAKYKEKPVEFLYQPILIPGEQWEDLSRITSFMMHLIQKVIGLYLEDPALRKAFDFPPLMEQLIRKEPGYSHAVPMTRIDLFYDLNTGDFQFCEINTDGSSGMVEARELQRIIGGSPVVRSLGIPGENLLEGEFMDSWVHAFQQNYREWCGFHQIKPEEAPRIAIVDLFENNPPSEFVEFQKAFQAAGYPCVIADARDLRLKAGRLTAGGTVIDAVYRRLVTWELVEHHEGLVPLIEAILEDLVCVIGPVRSQVPHNKRFFAILHELAGSHALTKEEAAFVRRHVPYTAVLTAENNPSWQHWLAEKDHFIIKPDDRYASHGVYAGRDFSREDWEKKMITAAGQSYLIQEYCRVPRMPMAVVTHEKIDFTLFNYLIGCFVYNGVFQGPYIRAGSQSIIGSVVECFTVPAFQVRA